MAGRGLKKVVNDGDFLVYLSSNEQQARLFDARGSIRSAFTTPLGDELDLDDNWEVCLKSITVRNIQNVVGKGTLFQEDWDGSFNIIEEIDMPAANYHDEGDVFKEVYQWLNHKKVDKEIPGDGSDARYIHTGTCNNAWCDWFNAQDISDIHDASSTVQDYFLRMSAQSQARVFNRRSGNYRAFGDGFEVDYDASSDGWNQTLHPGDNNFEKRNKWSWDPTGVGVLTYGDGWGSPWIAIPDKVATMLRMDERHFDDNYEVLSDSGTVYRQSFEVNNVFYHCFYMTQHEDGGTMTKIHFIPKSANLPLLRKIDEPMMLLSHESSDNMKIILQNNHYAWVQSKEGDTIMFLGDDDELIWKERFIQDCLDREALVNAKSDLWNVSIPGLSFRDEYRSHEDDLKSGSINPCVYVSRQDEGTVFIQFPQEGRYRPLKRLTESELSVEITDSSTKKHVLFWTGYTIVCLSSF